MVSSLVVRLFDKYQVSLSARQLMYIRRYSLAFSGVALKKHRDRPVFRLSFTVSEESHRKMLGHSFLASEKNLNKAHSSSSYTRRFLSRREVFSADIQRGIGSGVLATI